MNAEIIETSASRLWLDEDGILRAVNHPGCHFDLQSALENTQTARSLLAGRKAPIAVDLRGTLSISKEVREYYSSSEGMDDTLATALIVDSPVGRIIGNFFIGMNKPGIPVKIFDSEDKAIQWLRGFIK